MNPKAFRKVSPWPAVILMFFARDRFIDAAVAHALALCAENPQYQGQISDGSFPSQRWNSEATKNLSTATQTLVHAFWSSFLITCAFVVVALAVALLLGRIGFERPLDVGKCLSFAGGFLAGWATLFELGGFAKTISGEQLHELVHPLIFRILFLPGLAFAVLGQVW